MAITIQFRVNGGAVQVGTADVVADDVISLRLSSYAGVRAIRWEIQEFDRNFPCPAGWSTDPSSGVYYYNYNGVSGITPPDITMPSSVEIAAGQWGKWLFRAIATTASGTVVSDPRVGVRIVSPTLGLYGVGATEGSEFGGAQRAWAGERQHDDKLVDAAALAAAGAPDQKYLIQAGTVDAGTPAALALEALTTSIDIRSSAVPLKVLRSGVAASDVEALRVRRSVTDNGGNATSSTGSHIAFEIPNGAGVATDVANIKVQISSTIGPSANIVLSPMGSGTIAPALTVKGGGIIQLNSSDYAHDGYRLVLDASGNLSASLVSFAEVNAALALADAAIDLNGQQLTGVGTPSADTDAATKAYVDAAAQGLDIKASVLVATTASITLSGAQTIDGVSVTAGKRVLVKDQGSSANGLYLCAAGAWTRTTDLAAGAGAAGAFTFVEQGTANADTGWVCTSNDGADVVGTDSLAFTQFSSVSITAGDGLTKTGNTIDVVAADGSITVNANSIEASGAFGAKNISQTGATSITAGSGGFIGAQINRATSGTFTFGSNVTTIAGTAVAMTGIASVDNSGGTQTLGPNTTAMTIGKTATVATFAGGVTVNGSNANDVLRTQKNGIGTTKTVGQWHENTTNSGAQVSPMDVWSAFNGGTQVNLGMQWEPQSTSRGKLVWYLGTGSTAPTSQHVVFDSQDGTFGSGLQAYGFYVLAGGAGAAGLRAFGNNTGGYVWDSGDDWLLIKSYNTKGFKVQTGADSGGSGGVTRFSIDGSGKGYDAFAWHAVTSTGSNVTIALGSSKNVRHVVTEATTVAFSGAIAGTSGEIEFVQGAGFTVTMPDRGSGLEYDDTIYALGLNAIVSATASKRTVLSYTVTDSPAVRVLIKTRAVLTIP